MLLCILRTGREWNSVKVIIVSTQWSQLASAYLLLSSLTPAWGPGMAVLQNTSWTEGLLKDEGGTDLASCDSQFHVETGLYFPSNLPFLSFRCHSLLDWHRIGIHSLKCLTDFLLKLFACWTLKHVLRNMEWPSWTNVLHSLRYSLHH